MSLENFNLPFIYLIIKEAFAQKKLTYPIIMEFFKKKSWFGKTFTRRIQNQDFPYNWLNLLAPSLYEFFCQMDFHYSTKKYPNLVLCMDSLALKIEGLLRDLLFPEIDCVFLSHAHFDHITHIEFLDPSIPVCMGVGAKLLMESMGETGYFADYGEHICNKFRTGHKIKIGDRLLYLRSFLLFFVLRKSMFARR